MWAHCVSLLLLGRTKSRFYNMSFKIKGKPQSADIFEMSGDNVC